MLGTLHHKSRAPAAKFRRPSCRCPVLTPPLRTRRVDRARRGDEKDTHTVQKPRRPHRISHRVREKGIQHGARGPHRPRNHLPVRVAREERPLAKPHWPYCSTHEALRSPAARRASRDTSTFTPASLPPPLPPAPPVPVPVPISLPQYVLPLRAASVANGPTLQLLNPSGRRRRLLRASVAVAVVAAHGGRARLRHGETDGSTR